MRKTTFGVICLLACSAVRAEADASLRLGGLLDSAGAHGLDVDVWWAPNDHWSMGAGAGSSTAGEDAGDLSGNSIRLSTDFSAGGWLLGLAGSQWEDSGDVKTRVAQAFVGFTAANGLTLGVLAEDRALDVGYVFRTLQGVREGTISLDGRGVGLELGWFGEASHVVVRHVDHEYGRSLDRLRAVVAAPDTERVPRLTALADSLVTRAASAPSRELTLDVGRELARSSLRGEWSWQEDALTGGNVHILSVQVEFRVRPRLSIEPTLGFAAGDEIESAGFGGLALTLRR
jgi:hypothetical protein